MTHLADNVYAVILAGGSGTRFWPKSRHRSPKQLCTIGSDSKTMIEITLERLDKFIPVERRLIVTHKDQVDDTRDIVGDRCQWYLAEPEARNTANALTLAALEINARYKGDKKPIMVSLHADHVIQKVDLFQDAIRDGVQVAAEGLLTLLGIVPSYPETGYGYIEKGEALSNTPGAKVKSFREKPELSIATEYVSSGRFLWNAGIFIWKTETLLRELEEKLPIAPQKLKTLLADKGSFQDLPPEDLETVYGQLPKISIDHAVLETSKQVAVIDADIGWQDVGSWDALAKCFPTDSNGNLRYGDVISIDSEGTTIDSDGPLIACIGLKDMIVVTAKGAVLVCPRDRAQDVRKIVSYLKEGNREEYL
ncbi:mannose-1-phosphate guanylyltransferase [Pseudobacteriovorax antillogorgiicola]|uniref:Mannose-1-phosphate guanylyltransferase n=1 Tax=Pseudobacteriovorax antillogorgiicola TaxID=1513793 RepID=A0A1Y6CB80_9BACT|nr:sugar phosphate nucleotidyltransferase [Pseudobacteriovorax antillogorgiicola]TCS48671.1 mannose-1-phosphate guanylyltransferase [Pseudobacteriovorax antillogorgiicola]SMF54995.1 mannose-1-phosphate guanylyltransferase [Pseudobacteriovorax antillogorgiicola]